MATREVRLNISGRLEGEEWTIIEAFNYRANRLLDSAIIQSGRASIDGHLTITAAGASSSASLPSDELLAELFLRFRHFVLEKEPANFNRVISIIRRRAPEEDPQKALAWLKSRWQNALFNGAVEVTLKEQKVTAARLIDVWFNGEHFHSDSKKRAVLSDLQNMVGEPLSKYMLVDAVFNGVDCIARLHSGLKRIRRPPR